MSIAACSFEAVVTQNPLTASPLRNTCCSVVSGTKTTVPFSWTLSARPTTRKLAGPVAVSQRTRSPTPTPARPAIAVSSTATRACARSSAGVYQRPSVRS